MAERILVWALRVFGAVDLMALAAVVMPERWMAQMHAALGLGELPTAPIVGYLARSASALYGLHGAMILFVSFDVRRYWPLIRFLAIAALVHGLAIGLIDVAEGMPVWWRVMEGPGFAAPGVIVLLLQAFAVPEKSGFTAR